MNRESILETIENVLEYGNFDIPPNRVHPNLNNLKWLSKNLVIKNANNKKFIYIQDLVNKALEFKLYKN